MQPAPLLTNSLTVDMLERLLFNESKPSQLLPIDLAITTYLVLRRCVDHSISDSQGTIARRVCAERQAVAESLKRLERVGWISVGGRGRGLSREISLNFETFPSAQPVRDKITPAAEFLVNKYMSNLMVIGRRKFPKNWKKRQLPSAQRILSACGDDLQLARLMLHFAFTDNRFKKRTRTSLYHTVLIWPQITRAYHEQVKTQQTPESTTHHEPTIQCDAAA